MIGNNLRGTRLIDGVGLVRSLGCIALVPEMTGYGWSRNLTGFYIITAEGSDAYLNPVTGTCEWDYTEVGIYLPQYCMRPFRFDSVELGFYTTTGPVRLEEIELVDPKEFFNE